MAKIIAIVPVTDNEIKLLSLQRITPTEWQIAVLYETLDSDGQVVRERTGSVGSLSPAAINAFAALRAEIINALNLAENLTPIDETTIASMKQLRE